MSACLYVCKFSNPNIYHLNLIFTTPSIHPSTPYKQTIHYPIKHHPIRSNPFLHNPKMQGPEIQIPKTKYNSKPIPLKP
ncbi:hypothetical protein BofuT4_uP091300.1 [Botrytis cinerea T4]|uniref:Uncharacterized protein n=1 Tax=Botryotinia fuckeliana (strain T4) TaxID=999810 RepID=G2YF50_BOTF4|nr:hypothetical protein BofuT4_uP091300.1 [Botrytis cinerea T4]